MPRQSTRSKIKTEALRAIYDMEHAIVRLKRIDNLADGGSPIIASSIPALVTLIHQTKTFLERFHEDL